MISTMPDINKISLISRLLKIDNKQGVVVPFHFNKMQTHFHTHKSNRNIVLKHRQGGMSTSILADMLTDCIIIPHSQCAVISHEGRSTERLLDRVQFYYDSMDQNIPKPIMGAESRSEKTFPELHSSIYIGTAGARAFGRGDTIRKALLSELAHYEDGERILNGVEDSVPFTGELDIECTPNGEDNIFYQKWIRAREGKSPYKPFFYPWWWTEDYSLPRGLEFVLPSDRNELSYTDEEVDLIERHHLTENQIRWRRWKIGEKAALFWQEYPEDEVSCWIVIGEPVFDSDILNNLASLCYEGKRQSEGWYEWVEPEENIDYIIGVDTASGAPEGSYSAACVLNGRLEVCATFQARVEPHVLAGILRKMGQRYSHKGFAGSSPAKLVIERNFTGYAVLEQLQDYENVAYQRDFTTGAVTKTKGWWSNDQTRSMIMAVTKETIGNSKIWDANLVRQLRSYRFIKLKTKYREQAQTFDDLAIAYMLAMTEKKVGGTAQGYQGRVAGWNW